MRTGIALGSNLGDSLSSFRLARAGILALPGAAATVACLSAPIYQTEPVGCEPGANSFLNTVIEIDWNESPAALLAALQNLEAHLGRPRLHDSGRSRVIDLDILYCGAHVYHEEGLTIPHPRLHLRRFVLAPLAAIRPELCLPGIGRGVTELLRDLDDPARVELYKETW